MDVESVFVDMVLGKLRDFFLFFSGGNRLLCEGRFFFLIET